MTEQPLLPRKAIMQPECIAKLNIQAILGQWHFYFEWICLTAVTQTL